MTFTTKMQQVVAKISELPVRSPTLEKLILIFVEALETGDAKALRHFMLGLPDETKKKLSCIVAGAVYSSCPPEVLREPGVTVFSTVKQADTFIREFTHGMLDPKFSENFVDDLIAAVLYFSERYGEDVKAQGEQFIRNGDRQFKAFRLKSERDAGILYTRGSDHSLFVIQMTNGVREVIVLPDQELPMPGVKAILSQYVDGNKLRLPSALRPYRGPLTVPTLNSTFNHQFSLGERLYGVVFNSVVFSGKIERSEEGCKVAMIIAAMAFRSIGGPPPMLVMNRNHIVLTIDDDGNTLSSFDVDFDVKGLLVPAEQA